MWVRSRRSRVNGREGTLRRHSKMNDISMRIGRGELAVTTTSSEVVVGSHWRTQSNFHVMWPSNCLDMCLLIVYYSLPWLCTTQASGACLQIISCGHSPIVYNIAIGPRKFACTKDQVITVHARKQVEKLCILQYICMMYQRIVVGANELWGIGAKTKTKGWQVSGR